jgi:hypothetical protein
MFDARFAAEEEAVTVSMQKQPLQKEPRSIRSGLNLVWVEAKLLVVVDHSRITTDVGLVVLLDDRFVFSGSALLDHGLIAVAIAMNGYAGGRSGTNSDSHFISSRRHHKTNARNGQGRECKSCHQYAPSLLRTDSNSRFSWLFPQINAASYSTSRSA